jgi:hypothetical protein
MLLAAPEDESSRPATAGYFGAAKRRKGRSQRSQSSNITPSHDGSCSYDQYDYIEFDDGARASSPIEYTGASRAQKHEKKSKNPFVEFETREKRLMQERQWLLEEDGLYMQEKKKDLRHNRVQNYINRNVQDGDELYEERVFNGPMSRFMREKKHGNTIRLDPHALSMSSSLGSSRKRNNANKRGEAAQEAVADPSSGQVKALQQQLEEAMRKAGHFDAEDGKKKQKDLKQRKGTLDHFKELFQVSLDLQRSLEVPPVMRNITQDKEAR